MEGMEGGEDVRKCEREEEDHNYDYGQSDPAPPVIPC